MKFKVYLIVVTIVLFAGCATKEKNKKIIGKWVGTEWLVNSAPSRLKADKAFFVLNENSTYSFENAGNKEEGTYKMENDMMFTKPANQQEIMVKIFKLTKDSLVFDMNRSGQSERLTLRRN